MPNALIVQAATLTSTATFAGTNTQFSNAILAYCRAQGIDTTGTNQQVLDRFVAFLYADVRRIGREHTRRQKQLAKEAEVGSEVDTELGT